MALINCPECGKEISDTVETCLYCGYILHPEKKQQSKKKRLMLVCIIAVLLVIAVVGGYLLIQGKEASAFNNSKTAYTKINDAASICEDVMTDIYAAWMWGIYDWDEDDSYYTNALNLQYEVDVDLQAGAGEDSTPGDYLLVSSIFSDNDWQGCVDLVLASYRATGVYQEAEALLNEAQIALKAVSEGNADYQYYPMLKQYYAKVSAMLEFVKAPTGSFEQLKTTKNNYFNDILNFQGDLSFVFAE